MTFAGLSRALDGSDLFTSRKDMSFYLTMRVVVGKLEQSLTLISRISEEENAETNIATGGVA